MQEVYELYTCQRGMLDYLQERASSGHSDFLKHIRFPRASALPADKNMRDEVVQKTINRLREHIEEACFLALVARFEATLFSRIGIASHEIRTVLREAYQSPRSMSAVCGGFVKDKDDFANLAGIKSLIVNEKALYTIESELREVVDYRDHLAHGKRVKIEEVKRMSVRPTVESSMRLFTRILASLGLPEDGRQF